MRSYSLLTPGGANSGKKLVYLRVFDAAKNLYIERGIEQREMTMNIKHVGIHGLVRLAPGKEVAIPFSWNDQEGFMDKPESHHSFGKPLFAGRYNFQAFYDPSGIRAGDSLYNFMSSTEDRQSVDKLNFLGPAVSNPCLVFIRHKPAGSLRIEGINYIVANDTREEYYQYYRGSVADSNQVYISISQGDGRSPMLEVSMHRNKNLEWIEHNAQGEIRKHSLSRESGCPEVYYARAFQQSNNDILEEITDMDATGTVRTIRYREDGKIAVEEVYQMPGQIYRQIEYIYKGNKLVRKKRRSGRFTIPCTDVIETAEEPGAAD
jgi:hypothetical protein